MPWTTSTARFDGRPRVTDGDRLRVRLATVLAAAELVPAAGARASSRGARCRTTVPLQWPTAVQSSPLSCARPQFCGAPFFGSKVTGISISLEVAN